MGKVTYEYPVKDICGKIGKKATVGFAHRGDTKYTVRYGKRSTPVGSAEQAHRNKFSAAVKATRQRMLDSQQNAADKVAFAQQTKYKTLYQYVFNSEMAKLS
mgnify:FL=1